MERMAYGISGSIVVVLCIGVFLNGCMHDDAVSTNTENTAQPVTITEQSHIPRTMHLFYDGGETFMEINDRDVINEFAERQPLSVPLRRLPDRIIIEDVPETFVTRNDGALVTPTIGQLVINTDTKEIALYCQDSAPIPHGIVVGRILRGMEGISRQDGAFQGFVTK